MFHRKKRCQASSSTVGNKHSQKTKQRPLEEIPAPLQQQKPAVQIKLAFKDSYSRIQGFSFSSHLRQIYKDEVERNGIKSQQE